MAEPRPPGPPARAKASSGGAESVVVTCEDGWRLDVQLLAPPSPRAVAICGHAMMVDRRTMLRGGAGIVAELVAAGIAVLVPDLRGHGRSGPLPSEGGRWSYGDLVERDTPALHALARARFPALPLFDVGHSLYGHVALAYAARHPALAPDGIVMIASNTWLRECEPSWAMWMKKRAALELMNLLAIGFGRFPARLLRMGNADEAAPYVQDFVRSSRRNDWISHDGFSYRRALGAVPSSVMAIAGADDRLLATAASTERFVGPVPRHQLCYAGKDAAARLPGPMWEPLELPFDPTHMGLITSGQARPVWSRAARFILDESERLEGERARERPPQP